MWDIIKFVIGIIFFIAVIGIVLHACDNSDDDDHKQLLKEIGKETRETIRSLEEGWEEGAEEIEYNYELSHEDSMMIYYDIKNKIE